MLVELSGGGGRGKIENEHKKHKKRGKGRLPCGIFFGKEGKGKASLSQGEKGGQFIFVCYINFLLRLSCSRYIPLFRQRRVTAKEESAAPIPRTSLLSPKTVNSPRDIKGNAN